MPLFETVTDLQRQQGTVRRRRYGVLHVSDGELERLSFRPFPKLFAIQEFVAWQGWRRRHTSGDRCWVYFNQPRKFANFLAVKFVIATPQATLRTLHEMLRLLDQIAEIKGCDALLCDAANARISDRILRRYGWEAHAPSRWHRNYIRRLHQTQNEMPLASLAQR